MDGEPAHIFFMIAGSASANNEHLETVSKLSVILLNEDFRNKINNIKSKEELLKLINSADEANSFGEEEGQNTESKLILAVTACPTGIAHTYMAADTLRNKAKYMGVEIKVETNGSTGVKNRLTDEEIKNAAAVIVAADKQVEMARFEGKKVIIVPVAQAIKAPVELINKALDGDAPVYHHSGGEKSAAGYKKERTGFS